MRIYFRSSFVEVLSQSLMISRKWASIFACLQRKSSFFSRGIASRFTFPRSFPSSAVIKRFTTELWENAGSLMSEFITEKGHH
jgi:hypothetical protein